MEYAACQVSIAPIRAQASDKSEMVSQLLFGETVEVLNASGTWRLVRCSWDDYQGWVDEKQIKRIKSEQFDLYNRRSSVNLTLVEGLMASDHFVPLTMGASLPNYDGLRMELGNQSFQFSGQVATPGQFMPTGDWLVKVAKRYMHSPYLWGGRSPFGIDCSGLTQMVYKIAGIKLLRDASQQVTQGRTVDFMEQCQAGDLAFFDNNKGGIGHVGIMLSDCSIIHASGKVRLDKVDHFGIFNKEANKYSHQLRIVKRLLPDELPAPPNAEVMQEAKSLEAENQAVLFE